MYSTTTDIQVHAYIITSLINEHTLCYHLTFTCQTDKCTRNRHILLKSLRTVAHRLNTYFYNVVDVGNEPVHANLHQHDERSTYVLPYLRVFVRGEEKQVLSKCHGKLIRNYKSMQAVPVWMSYLSRVKTSFEVGLKLITILGFGLSTSLFKMLNLMSSRLVINNNYRRAMVKQTEFHLVKNMLRFCRVCLKYMPLILSSFLECIHA